jgi:hypothetical protein
VWIYLNDAFLSIVAHREQPENLLVRARVRGDLERIFPGCDVAETRTADYRFRAVIPRGAVAGRLAELALDIDYPSFKPSVQEGARHQTYYDVWSATMRGFLR